VPIGLLAFRLQVVKRMQEHMCTTQFKMSHAAAKESGNDAPSEFGVPLYVHADATVAANELAYRKKMYKQRKIASRAKARAVAGKGQ
jgi:hypothetical protein